MSTHQPLLPRSCQRFRLSPGRSRKDDQNQQADDTHNAHRRHRRGRIFRHHGGATGDAEHDRLDDDQSIFTSQNLARFARP